MALSFAAVTGQHMARSHGAFATDSAQLPASKESEAWDDGVAMLNTTVLVFVAPNRIGPDGGASGAQPFRLAFSQVAPALFIDGTVRHGVPRTAVWATSDLQPFSFANPADIDLLMTMAWDALARDGGYVLLRWRLPDDEWADADLVVGCTSTSVNLLGGGEPCDVVPTKAVATEGPAVAYLASRPPAREAPGTARQWPPPHAGCFPWALPNSRENIALEVVSQLVTLVSIAILCAESTLAERDTSDVPERGRYFLAEALCIGWFTVELTFRFSFSSAKSRFFYQPLNLVDLASITPFFVLLIARDTASNGFAAIRAIRVMRILKLADGSSSVEDLVLAITCTRNQLVQFMVLFFCQALLWASIVFYIEKDDGDPGFTSVPATLWWAYITFTSVGYGDIVPITAWGRVVVSFAVLMGLLLLTLPTTIFTDTFTGFFDRRRNVQRKAESDNRIREIHKVEHYLLVAKGAIDSR